VFYFLSRLEILKLLVAAGADESELGDRQSHFAGWTDLESSQLYRAMIDELSRAAPVPANAPRAKSENE
jgi:hypothetical protein